MKVFSCYILLLFFFLFLLFLLSFVRPRASSHCRCNRRRYDRDRRRVSARPFVRRSHTMRSYNVRQLSLRHPWDSRGKRGRREARDERVVSSVPLLSTTVFVRSLFCRLGALFYVMRAFRPPRGRDLGGPFACVNAGAQGGSRLGVRFFRGV